MEDLKELQEEFLEGIPIEEETEIEEIEVEPRKNPFTVISLEAVNVYEMKDIQSASAWTSCPYDDYIEVPDSLVDKVMETRGYCEIIFDETTGAMIDVEPLEIPEIPTEEEEISDTDLMLEIMADHEVRLCELELGGL